RLYQLVPSSCPALTRYRTEAGPIRVPNCSRAWRSSGANRRLKPTCSRSLPDSSIAPSTLPRSSSDSASGFSTNTALPASSARRSPRDRVARRDDLAVLRHGPDIQLDHGVAAWHWCRVPEEHRDGLQLAVVELLVGLHGGGEVRDMRDQRFDIEPAPGDQVE